LSILLAILPIRSSSAEGAGDGIRHPAAFRLVVVAVVRHRRRRRRGVRPKEEVGRLSAAAVLRTGGTRGCSSPVGGRGGGGSVRRGEDQGGARADDGDDEESDDRHTSIARGVRCSPRRVLRPLLPHRPKTSCLLACVRTGWRVFSTERAVVDQRLRYGAADSFVWVNAGDYDYVCSDLGPAVVELSRPAYSRLSLTLPRSNLA